jgi:soluble lytic murein transglycosylase-like protein
MLAAALAAGLTTFAAHSQEAPAIALGANAAATEAAPTAKPDKAAPEKKKRAKTEKVRNGRDNGSVPGVDMTTTSSVKPDLVLKPRKGSKKVLSKATAGEKAVVAGKAAAAAGGYDTIISRYATAYNVPVSLAHAVIKIESNYRSTARGRAGEIGLMQIKPATARMMGYSGSAKGLYDPDTNIRYGMKYLAKARELGGGSTCGTILKYNSGHGARRMNKISAAYCSKVKRHMGAS